MSGSRSEFRTKLMPQPGLKSRHQVWIRGQGMKSKSSQKFKFKGKEEGDNGGKKGKGQVSEHVQRTHGQRQWGRRIESGRRGEGRAGESNGGK